MGQSVSSGRRSKGDVHSRQLRSIKPRICKILENDVYSHGIEAKFVINMMDDIMLAYKGKIEEIRVPEPIEGRALIKTIRVDGTIGMQNSNRIHDPDSTHAKFKSRRSMIKELRGAQGSEAGDSGALFRKIENEIEVWEDHNEKETAHIEHQNCKMFANKSFNQFYSRFSKLCSNARIDITDTLSDLF
ncbi:hypothetical protein HI914_02251 [Erysiphe necator]|nr:hypothetical protein HI914_02251 [Erysiphe necator]